MMLCGAVAFTTPGPLYAESIVKASAEVPMGPAELSVMLLALIWVPAPFASTIEPPVEVSLTSPCCDVIVPTFRSPAAVIATYSLGLVLGIGCAERRNLRPLVSGAIAIAAGFALAAFYILPAAWEQRWVQITQAVSEELYPAMNFLFARANDPDFVAFNWKVSWVAVGVMIVTAVAACFAARRRKEFHGIWWTLIALGVASVALMFRPSGWLWRRLPELQFVQFPWRWLGVLR